jgi:hypothetical protein
MRADVMETVQQADEAAVEEAVRPQLDLEYLVPVDPMDDLQCESCQ